MFCPRSITILCISIACYVPSRPPQLRRLLLLYGCYLCCHCGYHFFLTRASCKWLPYYTVVEICTHYNGDNFPGNSHGGQ
ncbi:hypothetical protein GDO81_009319 [Engystomops pustulosus]|uniref:Secreted protein n=1 Tax=Engystomops pustulosus TaxID=76066 RepID=A0AAV7BQJ9_ENGPU|nr:hypothetical protein GDO81_009319 [Engystomops pustulosus]